MTKKIIITFSFILFSAFSNAENNDYTENCDVFNFSTANKIREISINGLYINPFKKNECFFLLFNENDFFDQSIISEKHKDATLLQMALFNKIKNIAVRTVLLKELDLSFNFMRFARDGSSYKYYSFHMENYEIYKKYGDMLIFFHEVFHLQNQNKNEATEYVADLFALFNIIKYSNITQDELIELADVSNMLRERSFSEGVIDNNPMVKFKDILSERSAYIKIQSEVHNCTNFSCLSSYTQIFLR